LNISDHTVNHYGYGTGYGHLDNTDPDDDDIVFYLTAVTEKRGGSTGRGCIYSDGEKSGYGSGTGHLNKDSCKASGAECG